MNIAEAARINTVLGETLDGLQTMKFVTPYVLEHAEHMARDTSEELASKLVAHRAALQTANEDVTDDVLADSAHEPVQMSRTKPGLCRTHQKHLRRNPTSKRRLTHGVRTRSALS